MNTTPTERIGADARKLFAVGEVKRHGSVVDPQTTERQAGLAHLMQVAARLHHQRVGPDASQTGVACKFEIKHQRMNY